MPTTEDVTLVEGSSFCVSDRTGDMVDHRPHGVFFQDTRIVSAWQLTVDHSPLQPLSVALHEPFSATFIGRAVPRAGGHEATIVVERRRMIAGGMREDIVLRNYGTETAGCRLMLTVDSDFADLFDVKEGRGGTRPEIVRHAGGGQIELAVAHADDQRGVRIRAAGALVAPGALIFQAIIPAQQEWRTTVEVLPSTAGRETEPAFPVDRPVAEAVPSRRMRDWRAARPRVRAHNPTVERTLRRSLLDLGALRIHDPMRPSAQVVAAGAPWFMALFGRDALITSWMALPLDPSLAMGTLQTLAAHQGSRVDMMSEEEPGKILHEVRLGDPGKALGGSNVYYGSVDATPLFVMLLDAAACWGLPWEEISALLPAADAALDWITQYGDLDGDGFIEYQRKTDRGLLNQGWKDSHDSVTFNDGRAAEPPIALAEAQAYVYGAFLSRSHLAMLDDDPDGAAVWRRRAFEFRERFNEAFWLPERGYYAMALERDKRPVDALTSNIGHCLWTGIAHEDKARRVADHLMSDAMFSGWGVRTLAATAKHYNPVSYHNGSIWPHDNAIILSGLVRYGHLEAAQRLATSMLATAESFGGRLPELFCGFDRSDVPVPVPYPTSCSPQAWAAASPIAMLRVLLRLQPCLPHGTLRLSPALPPGWGRFEVQGLMLGGSRLGIDTAAAEPVTSGLPAGVELNDKPTGPMDHPCPHAQ